MDSPASIIRNGGWDDCHTIGTGAFSTVYRVGHVAVKVKRADGVIHDIERRIYERLGKDPSIVEYYGETPADTRLPKGLMLEYYPAGTLLNNLTTSSSRSERWPLEAAEAVRYIHINGVIHGDIGAHNFFLKKDGSIVLGDFGGSRIDRSSCRVLSAVRYTRGMKWAEYALEPTEKDDLFALGSVLYEIKTKKQLHADKTDTQIREMHLRREFPDLTSFDTNIRVAIEKCWHQEYVRAADVIRDLCDEGSPSRVRRLEGQRSRSIEPDSTGTAEPQSSVR